MAFDVNIVPLRLKANTSFFVSTTGNDNNDGLTSGTAWATPQHAWNYLAQKINFNGFAATINIADGSYVGINSNDLGGSIAPKGKMTWTGNTTTPANVVFTENAIGYAWNNYSPLIGALIIKGITFNATYGVDIEFSGGNTVDISQCGWGPITDYICLFVNEVFCIVHNGITINAPDLYNGFFAANSQLQFADTFTISQPLAITLAFIICDHSLVQIFSGFTTSGSAVTGQRFIAQNNGIFNTFNGSISPDASPGSVSGIVQKGSFLTGQRRVQVKTSAYTVTTAFDGYIFSNLGTTTRIDFTLPSAAASANGYGYLEYTFICEDTDGLRVIAPGSDTINLAGTISAAGGRIDTTQIGAVVKLISTQTNVWVAESVLGTWTVT